MGGWILGGLFGLFGLAVLLVASGALTIGADQNETVFLKMQALNKKREFAKALELEKEGNPDVAHYEHVKEQADFARAGIHSEKQAVLEDESIRWYNWQVQKWRQDNRGDREGYVKRLDEYLARFPETSQWNRVADERLRLTGEASPATKGRIPMPEPSGSPSGARSLPNVLQATTDEADTLAAEDRFAEALKAYDRFLANAFQGVPESDTAVYRKEVEKRKKRLVKKAREAYDKADDRGQGLISAGRLDEAEAIYRKVIETYGVDEIVVESRIEIERIQEKRKR